MKKIIYLLICIFLFIDFATAQNLSSETKLKDHVNFLASDALKGRFPGTAEDAKAAGYIKNQFTANGLKLMGKKGFQYFDLTMDVKHGEKNSLYINETQAKLTENWAIPAYSDNSTINTGVVFAGFGFNIQTDSIKWNDYQNIDVKGKWVMILRGDPEMENNQSFYIPYSNDRSKVLTARDKGAAGVILVSGVNYDKEDKLIDLQAGRASGNAGIPVIHVTRTLADQILKPSNKLIKELEDDLIKNKKVASFVVNSKIKATINLVQTKITTQNVVAMLEGNDPVKKNEYIVIGAHYDHLGMGGSGSGSRVIDTVAIHNGADDNASGVAGIIELSRLFAQNKKNLKHSVIFIAFGAEERGLIGSKYFMNNCLVAKDKIIYMANLDMVGRLNTEETNLMIGGIGTAVENDTIAKELSAMYKIKPVLSPDGFGASDHSSFYSDKIPVMFFNTGSHDDYHTPADDADLINYKGAQKITDFIYNIVLKIDQLPANLTYKQTASKGEARQGRGFKVTFGIIPNFEGSDTKGMRVDGVRTGGPADKAGMLKGDIIIAVNGEAIQNIYDYMNRLTKLKEGDVALVDVIRDGKKIVLTVQL